jgi:ubiquinone/menaquinone biosynthesis C-methylase UbiE
LEDRKILEIGAGSGNQILLLLKLGAKPENILVNELLPERIKGLKAKLPAAIQILEGNALDLNIAPESIDIVLQSMVFTSILDLDFKKALASRLWSFIRRGGGLIWYDFTFDNPSNADVKGIKYDQIVELFPEGHIRRWRLTLAPPLARKLSNMIFIYKFLNLFPFLKTHLLCWIRKK